MNPMHKQNVLVFSQIILTSHQLQSCASAGAGARDAQEWTEWSRSLGALQGKGEVGWETSALIFWRRNSHYPPKKTRLIRKLLIKLEVHSERVKYKSTARISESIWRSESKCLCLRNGLANFTIIMKNKKKTFNLRQQLFTRSEQELVLWFWYINRVKELLKWNQIIACIIIFLLFSQKKKNGF